MRRVQKQIAFAMACFVVLMAGWIAAAETQIFTHEGEARKIEVTGDRIVVDYDASRCEFDRASGRLAARRTQLDGWTPPSRLARPAYQPHLVGPGVVYQWFDSGEPKPEVVEAARADFDGKSWRALQPADFLDTLTRGDMLQTRKQWGTWGAILNRLNEASRVEAAPAGSGAARRYTMKDGLASNIVTQFAQVDGTLWAACVDIYDKAKGDWGPGGLCRYDATADRWVRVDTIAGHPVRWVTLLQSDGDELWAGFREGSGIDSDVISYGMGLYPGNYQPVAKALVLARLKGGKWDVFSRAPVSQPKRPFRMPGRDDAPTTPTERPLKLLRHGNQVFLFSETASIVPSGNWDVKMDGHCSRLDAATGQWRTFELYQDIDADHLTDLNEQNGELLASTNHGVFRWQDAAQPWQFLDPQSPLKNPSIGALAALNGEVWAGYQKQSIGVTGEQGLSRYNERTGKWSWMPPAELGTSCPVTSIATLPDGSLWVLFRPRYHFGPTMEFAFYPHERVFKTPNTQGIGRFSGNKWEFPVALSGVPTTETLQFKTPDGKILTSRYPDRLPIMHMATAAGKLFVVNRAGVFMGPEPWTAIYQVPREASGRYPYNHLYGSDLNGSDLIIEPSDDGQALLITDLSRPKTAQDSRQARQAVYRPGDKNVEFKPIRLEGQYDPTTEILMRGAVKDRGMTLETPLAAWTAQYGVLTRRERTR